MVLTIIYGCEEITKTSACIWLFPFSKYNLHTVEKQTNGMFLYHSSRLLYASSVCRKSRQNIVFSWACELHDFRMFPRKRGTVFDPHHPFPHPFLNTNGMNCGARASRLSLKETFHLATDFFFFSNSLCLSIMYTSVYTSEWKTKYQEWRKKASEKQWEWQQWH